MILRKAEAADIAAILEIQTTSGVGFAWQESDFLAYNCSVCEIDEQIAGYLLARQVADAEFEVLHVAVAPGFRRRGVASALIRNQLRELKGDWFLEVRHSNAAARALYEKAGFGETGIRKSYYEHPAEDGIVMSIRSC